jgi:hypothetical protein
VRIEATKFFHPKTADSIGDVPVDPEVMAIFRGYRPPATAHFVIESTEQPKPGRYEYYRCNKHFGSINAWLREKTGLSKRKKALHTLRKEFGSQLATAHGIFAARKALRHSDITMTNEFYADTTPKVRPGLGYLLNATKPEEPENVVALRNAVRAG